jgi:hypothetical protein
MSLETLDIYQLAQVLHKSVATLRSDLVRSPHSLPGCFRVPGSRRPLWLKETVEAFVLEHARRANALPIDSGKRRSA